MLRQADRMANESAYILRPHTAGKDASSPAVLSIRRTFTMNIINLINALPGAAAQGLIWGIMAIGVYLTFRILDVADLTVDGTMCTGGAVCIMMMQAGFGVWPSMLAATGSRNACRTRDRHFPHLHGYPGDPRRNPDTACPLFGKSEGHGKGKSGDQRQPSTICSSRFVILKALPFYKNTIFVVAI